MHAHTTRYIKAEHLSLALVTAKARKLGLDTGRFAAFSNGHDKFGHGCPSRPHSDEAKRRLVCPPMFHGILGIDSSLIKRVCTHYGPLEVKRTWGIGYKALLKQIEQGA
jgi:hypothetical protein